MPVYLPPISRRSFIARTLAAASGVVLGRGLLAASKEVDPHAWALFSDPHIAADRSMVSRGVNMAEHLARAVMEVNSLASRPAAVFVCGDCAYSSGRSEDYTEFCELIKPLREADLPLHLALGNHDNREHFREVVHPRNNGDSAPVPSRETALIRAERVNWFMLDSLEQTNSTPGLLGPEQLKWLAESLDANKDKPALVMVHHNPGISGNMGLKDTVALFEVIRPRKHVKAYVFGHTHSWKLEQDSSGLHLVNLPATGYVFQKDDPSGWVHAHVEPDSLRLELHTFDTSHKAHGEVANLKWRES